MVIYEKGLRIKAISLCLIIFLLIFPLSTQAKETRETPQLTSLEAAKMAYQEACQWD